MPPKPHILERPPRILDRPLWMTHPSVLAVLDAFAAADVPIRFVGGCVRDTLMELPVKDVDATTPAHPDQVTAIAAKAGITVVPTGLSHGTVTLVSHGHPMEVTTLRADLSTDGRHAEVAFTQSWDEDAARRDFTINALYLDGEGRLYDPVGGADHLNPPKVIFIGDPATRIQEDYLRILRFFRFVARFGISSPDEKGLVACAAHMDGLRRLSPERITSEILKILEAPNPLTALGHAETHGILQTILPAGHSLSDLANLLVLEHDFAITSDPVRRLAALLPRKSARKQPFLVLSKKQMARIRAAHATPPPDQHDLKNALYALGPETVLDQHLVAQTLTADRLHAIQNWQRPTFPVSGTDLIKVGISPGPEMGTTLRTLEAQWIASDFSLTKETLLTMVN